MSREHRESKQAYDLGYGARIRSQPGGLGFSVVCYYNSSQMALDYAAVAELLGGAATLKADIHREFDLISVVRAGIPAISIRSLAEKTETPISLVGEIVRIDKSTLMRRLRERRRLKPDESDRVLRFARTFAVAQSTLGDRARAWLNMENRALGGAKPIELLDTDSGAREVENVLGRIEHGVFS